MPRRLTVFFLAAATTASGLLLAGAAVAVRACVTHNGSPNVHTAGYVCADTDMRDVDCRGYLNAFEYACG